MFVPNFVPEPLEVPGNVTLLPWRERVRFVNRVLRAHLLSLVAIGGLSMLPMPIVPPWLAWASAGLTLLALDVIRIYRRGRSDEAKLSMGFFVVSIVSLALATGVSEANGWPVWAIPMGPVMLWIYAMVARKDFSFVGGTLLAMIGTLVAVSTVCLTVRAGRSEAIWASLLSLTYLVYFVYDLASLQSRRRKDEIGGAVVDLYRDVFNFFGYFQRVVAHWKKHRIWSSSVFAPKNA